MPDPAKQATFDVGDTSLWPQEAAKAPETPPAAPERDPATGRFVKPEQSTEGAAAPATAPAAPTLPPAAPKHPSWLMEQAADFGVTPEEAAEYSTDQLGRMVRRFSIQASRGGFNQATAKTLSDAEVRPSVTPPAPEEPIDLGVDEALYDPAVIALMKNTVRQSRKALSDAQKLVESGQAQRLQEAAERGIEAVDEAIEALGPAFQLYFGTGPGRQLTADSPEMKRRIMLLQAAGVKHMSLVNPRTIKRELAEAVKLLVPSAAPAKPAGDAYSAGVAGKGPAAAPRVTAEQWDAAALASPTQQKTELDLPKGEKRAVKNLERKLATDASLTADDDEILGTLLPGNGRK